MTTRGKITNPVKVSINGSPFLADGEVQRYQINDRPPAIRTSAAEGYLGQYRDALIIGGIVDAYAGRAIGPHGPRESISEPLAHGHIHVGHDVEGETRFGVITSPRQKRSLTYPTIANESTNQGVLGGANGSVNLGQQYNDRPVKNFAGTTNAGPVVWEVANNTSSGVNDVNAYVWTGTSFASSFSVVSSAAGGDMAINFDTEVHKGRLYFIGTLKQSTALSNYLYYTTTGAGSAAAGAVPTTIAHQPGTRLIDAGNTLWIVAQGASNRIDLYKSTDNAATWTTVATNAAVGQIRSVFTYRDPTNTSQLMVMTTDRLYYIDQTNSVLVPFYTLPYPGRGAIVFGNSLYLFMDSMRVTRYTQTNTETTQTDISPGGGEAMPSGKDFGVDSSNAVVLALGSQGIYATWSGNDTAGSIAKQLCLEWVESQRGEGWHFIWRRANTTNHVSYGARGLILDPTSGDLLFFGVTSSASVETRDSVWVNKIETDPRLLTANIYETTGYFETPDIALGPTAISTTFFEMFYNSVIAAGGSLQTKFGVDGAAATASTLETSAVTIALAHRLFPSDDTAAGTAASTGTGVGSNFNTIRVRHLLAGTATVSPILYNSEIGFAKIPDVKDVFVVNVIVDPEAVDMTIPNAETVWTNLATVRSSKTKVVLNYSLAVGNLSVLSIPEARLREVLPTDQILPAVRAGTVRLVLAQV